MRLFIAIELPNEIKQKLALVIKAFKKCDLDAKWVKEENLHLSLKFLGEVDEEKLEEIKKIITVTAAQFTQTEVNIESFGFFPNENSPRVFFISTDKEDILKEISLKLENKLEKIGFAKEGRFKSHLTIARLRSKKNIDCLKKEIKNITIEEKINVHEVTLLKSTLTPTGPIYEKIFSAPLKNEPPRTPQLGILLD